MKPLAVGLSDKRTATFERFASALKGLNDFYWTFRVASTYLTSAPEQSKRVIELVPTDIGKHLDVTVAELGKRASDCELHARFYVLVHALTLYEDFIKATLTALGASLPDDKFFNVKIRLSDVPQHDTNSCVRQMIVNARAQKIVDAEYSERQKMLAKLLRELKLTPPPDDKVLDALLLVVCKIRNCVVHSAGIADAETLQHVSKELPAAQLDVPLPLTEDKLWEFVGALKKSALTLDEAISPSPPLHKPKQKRRRTGRRNPGRLAPAR